MKSFLYFYNQIIQMSTTLIFLVLSSYFIVLILIAHFTSKNATSETFFTGNRQSPWYLVAFGMIGASLSGVTFISVPGQVMNDGMGYFQVVLGDAMQFFRSSEEQFDVITGMDIIEHFTKDELVELLQLIQSKLKKGGMAIFRTPNMDAPIATAFAIGDFTHENYLNASSAEQVMLSCGFGNVRIRPSFMRVNGLLKEALRGILYRIMNFRLKLQLFATARSSQKVLLTPNLIIVGVKAP